MEALVQDLAEFLCKKMEGGKEDSPGKGING